MTASKTPLLPPEGYADWLAQLKVQIARARQRPALAVNAELIQLYARIGRDIRQRQNAQGWGAKVIDRLARDLKDAFPEMRGWSFSNLKTMRFLTSTAPMSNLVSRLSTQLDQPAARLEPVLAVGNSSHAI